MPFKFCETREIKIFFLFGDQVTELGVFPKFLQQKSGYTVVCFGMLFALSALGSPLYSAKLMWVLGWCKILAQCSWTFQSGLGLRYCFFLGKHKVTGECVPFNFMANWQVPKFSLNNCAQSPQKSFLYWFCTNPVLKCTKCHISTNLSNFLKLCLLLVYC